MLAAALARPSIYAAIKVSAAARDISWGRSLHGHLIKFNLLIDTSFSNHVLNMYAKCSLPDDARLLFDEMPHKNVVSFSTLMSAYSGFGYHKHSLHVAKELHAEGLEPNEFVFSGAISSCSKLDWVFSGKQVHARVMISGLATNPFVKASLIGMYAKFGDIPSAVSAFELGSSGDPAVINSMISGLISLDLYCDALRLLRDAWNSSYFRFTNHSFASLIKACGNLEPEIGQHLHGLIIKWGSESDRFVGASLVDMYGRFGDLDGMEEAFRAVTSPDLALQNAIIVGSAQNGFYCKALKHFQEMKSRGFDPDECTLSSALKACGGLTLLNLGRIIHGFAEINGNRQRLVVGTALIDMYMKCGDLEDARSMFEKMSRKNIITYNTMIAGLGQTGRSEEAATLFISMKREGLIPDLATLVAAISSAGGPGRAAIYSFAVKFGLGLHPMIENVLLDGFLRDGEVKEALNFFHQMRDPNVVSWSTVISGLVQLGFFSEALELFRSMQSTETTPNVFTFSSVLKASSGLADFDQGRSLHASVIKHGLLENEYTASSVVEMYASCGALKESQWVFLHLPEKVKQDSVMWNAMIGCHTSHGDGLKALELYEKMVENGVMPSHITFVSLLSACSRCGMVEEGVCLFNRMVDFHRVNPRMEHYACMVDLFGRAGQLERARSFIESMPFKANSWIWNVFLASCRTEGEVEMADLARNCLMRTGDDSVSTHVLMHNVYSEVGRWEDAEKSTMKFAESGAIKVPGTSWVQTRESSLHRIPAF